MNGRNFLLSATRAVLANRFAGVVSVLFGCVFLVASCAKPAAGPACSGGLDSCGTACVDTATNHDNCGACGTACSATQECTAGKCQCQSGYILCGGACVASDASNCGSCGTKCTGATNVCSNGTCGTTCPSGTTMCTGGACVDFTDSNLHCGSCTNACRTDQVCTASACVCPTGQTVCNGVCTAGTCGGGTGGNTGTGVGGNTGTGTGGNTGTTGTGGNTGTTGTGGNTGTTGTGGSTTGVGGATGTAGATGMGARACAPASTDVLSDFEEGTTTGAVMIQQGTPVRTGFWYVYYPGSPAAIMSGESQTPARSDSAILQAMTPDVPSGDTATCDKFALHATGSGFGTAPNNYAGFGSSFLPASPPPSTSQIKNPYDVTQYDGITFKVKTGGGPTTQPVYFEMLTKENQPDTSGGNICTATPTKTCPNSAADTVIDLYNSRGQMVTVSSTAWTTVYVPFGTLIPRWIPGVGASNACTATAASGDPKCQPPHFLPTDVLAIQFSFYNDPGFPTPSPAGSYNLWVDDVAFYNRSATVVDLPAPPSGGGSKPFPQNASVGPGCTKPAGPAVDGKFLVSAYNQWKAKFVVSSNGGYKVIRPENNNDTVSEGIGYGMLIAVYMNDKTLFDGLWTYAKSGLGCAVSNPGCLMTWNSTGGSGSATDADEDSAFALLEASKQWGGGTYSTDAMNVMHSILASETSTGAPYVWGGSNFKSNNTTTNDPSYYAPAWYREFAKFDTTNTAAWNALANNIYTQIGNATKSISTQGLISAWCNQTCTATATNADSTGDVLYQYDSHRIPWRIGLDACWNNNASANSYLALNSAFFSGVAATGIGRIFDEYTPSNGHEASNTVTNSASIIGTAAVGAMANGNTYKTFRDDAYQAVFDMATRGTMADTGSGKSPYSYFNATVGLLTLLTMTGNLTAF